MMFPKRTYTVDEVYFARALIQKGHRHRLRIVGSSSFKVKTKETLRLVKVAGYYDFLRTYIRAICEVDGLTQLREGEASIWANIYAVEEPVDAASLFVQKAWQMKKFIEGKVYYGYEGETDALNACLKFLMVLMEKIDDPKIKEICEKRLQTWRESRFF